MTDNPDNEGFNIDEESFDNFEKKKGTLGSMWDKPMFKIGIVVVAALAIFGTILLMGGNNKEKPEISMVPSGSEVTAPPGTEEASPAYVDAVKQQNEARTEEAERTGSSSLPTPIEPPVGSIGVQEDNTASEDPLQRWRQLQEERLERELQRTQALTPEEAPPPQETAAANQEDIQNLSQTMVQQMQAILDSRNTIKTGNKRMTDPSYLDKLKEDEEEKAEDQDSTTDADIPIEEIIVPAGEIAYGQLITEANSDMPGPILAQIAGGPLNGARIIGSFQVQKEKLTLRFNTVVLDGISHNIDALALDPASTLPAIATNVNHHYLKKVALPMAAAFVQGMANAISESGRTSITVEGDVVATEEDDTSNDQEVASGIEDAGQELSDILNDISDDIETTIRIESGTQIGVLFLQPVVKSPNQTQYYDNSSSVTGSIHKTMNPSIKEAANSNAR